MRRRYTTYEVAEIFGVTFRTVYNWMRAGKLRAVKIGSRWYIPKEAVSELLEHGEQKEERRSTP